MENTPNFFAIIPANVRYCKGLEPNAKLLYGELTALAQKEGYCWAQNSYFAELYDVDDRTIRRWLASLKDKGFIAIDEVRQGFYTQRRIWISQEIQKMFAGGQNCPGGRTEMSGGADKNALHSITINKTYEGEKRFFREASASASPPLQKKSTPPPKKSSKEIAKERPNTNPFGRLQKIFLTDLEYQELCQEYGANIVKLNIEKLENYSDYNPKAFDSYANHAAVLRNWLIKERETSKAGRSTGVPFAGVDRRARDSQGNLIQDQEARSAAIRARTVTFAMPE